MVKKKLVAFVVFDILLFIFLIFFILNAFSFIKVFTHSKTMIFPSYEIIRFNIFGSSFIDEKHTVSANFSILNTDGSECAVIERSWKGQFFYIVFVEIELGWKSFYFPEKIICAENFDIKKAGKGAKTGTKLYSYYIEDGSCILLGEDFDKEKKRAFYDIAKLAFNPIFSVFFKRRVVSLASCENGYSYVIYADSNEGLFLKKE